MTYIEPGQPRFNEGKATQLAAFLLEKAGKPYPYMSIIKLIYFIDRESLLRRGIDVSTDSYYCLPRGPIVSEIMNLSKRQSGREEGIWSNYIEQEGESKKKYNLQLKKDRHIKFDELSKFEIDLAQEIYSKYEGKSQWELEKISHQLPEYVEPDSEEHEENRVPLSVEDIMSKAGKSSRDIKIAIFRLEGRALLDWLK